MSYLSDKSSLANFNQAVISLWFRVPQQSIDAAKAAYDAAAGDTSNPIPPFAGIVPLVVMGKQGEEQDIGQTFAQAISQKVINQQITNPGTSSTSQTGTTTITITETFNIGYTIGPVEVDTYKTVVTTYPTDITALAPTCIGVGCSSGSPVLYVNFETAQRPDVTGYDFDLRSIDPAILDNPGAGGDFTPPFQSGTRITQYTGVFLAGAWIPVGSGTVISDTVGKVLVPGVEVYTPAVYHYVDFSELKINRTGAISSNTIPLVADQWHHILISLDLKDREIKVRGFGIDEVLVSNPVDHIEGAARLFVALDDIDYLGQDLSENWYDGYPDLHGVITEDAVNLATSIQVRTDNPDTPDVPIAGIPQYSLSDMRIPCNGQSMGFPAPAEWVNNVLRVEMAEFQMWTGVTMDTGIEANRRAFIDCKRDQNGKPIREKDGSVIFRPVNPKKAEALLGRRPDILLHGNTKWINGENTGVLGITVNPDGSRTKNPAGQFIPTGLIKKYKPEPSIAES